MIIEEIEIGEIVITEKGAVPGVRDMKSTDIRDNTRGIIAAVLQALKIEPHTKDKNKINQLKSKKSLF